MRIVIDSAEKQDGKSYLVNIFPNGQNYYKNIRSNEKMKKVLIGILALIMVLGLVGCKPESERNKIGSSIDWGPNHYWNSSTESVERKPW